MAEAMKPQTFCCLCGKSYGAPHHARTFNQGRFTYPSMIEMHDVVRRSQGGDPKDLDNNIALCLECHGAIHDGRLKVEFRKVDDEWEALRHGEWAKVWVACLEEGV